MRDDRRNARQFQNTYPHYYPGKRIKTVTFIVTHQCNLRCSYCYETHKGDGKMSLETAQKCVDLLFSEDAKSRQAGGDMVQRAVGDASQRAGQVSGPYDPAELDAINRRRNIFAIGHFSTLQTAKNLL